MKQISKHPSHALIQSAANLTVMGIPHQLGYRFPMPVADLMVFSSTFHCTAYYVCPRCHITMEREYQSYCDRCGQRLDWRNCRNARIIYSSTMSST